MPLKYCFLLLCLLLGFTQCKSPGTQEALPSDDALMDTVQRRTFNYFWEGAEPNSGLARERIHMDGVYPENDRNVVTSGGSGFGIMTILAGRRPATNGENRFLPRNRRPLSRCLSTLVVWRYGQGETLRPERQWRRSGRNSLHHAGTALRPPILHKRE
mgnify:CR=1 FL=1